jgi:hypothetical protein
MDKSLITIENIKKVYSNKNYRFYDTTKDYNINIFGIRNDNLDVDNLFDDNIGILYGLNGKEILFIADSTTLAGKYFMEHPMNPKGTASIIPNQYVKSHKIGLHLGKYNALVQCGILKICRDNNKDLIYDIDPSKAIVSQYDGINIHHAGIMSMSIDNWSAACQVLSKMKDWNEFIRIVEKSAKLYGNLFTYTLLEEKDFKQL